MLEYCDKSSVLVSRYEQMCLLLPITMQLCILLYV